MLNLRKIKKINFNISKNCLFYKDFSHTSKQILNDVTYNLLSSSSSIVNHTDFDDRYILIVRNLNYIIDKSANAHNLNEHTVTFNRIIVLNKYFNIIRSFFLETPFQNVPYIGIEDVRLFVHDNAIYYIGSYCDEQDQRIKIVSGIYDINDTKLIPNIITPSFHTNNNWEKNWVFFNNNGDLNIIYKWKPLYICKINYDTKKLDLLNINDKVPAFFNMFRGSTNGVDYDNKIWFIVHYSKKIKDKNYYLHVFIVFDKQMNLLGYSNPFKFKNCIIEYCIGMTINKKTNNFIITYSLLDRSTNLIVLSSSFINSLITYL
jgi:hypothetical protein